MSNPLIDLVSRGESGADYNAYNRGTYVDDQGHKRILGPNGAIDFSKLTVGDVMDRQHLPPNDPHHLFAVGRYQVIPQTMKEAVNALQLDRNSPFTPELQDRIFSDHLIVGKRPAIHDYITGEPGVGLEDAQRALAAEWASFGDPDKNGASHYPPPNHASISLAESATALDQMRATYQADLAKGMTPEQAWHAVTVADALHERAASTHTAPPPSTHANGLLEQGTHDPAVATLQADLALLGYTDHRGQPLSADGSFGLDTRHAVERFQRDHHLAVDGKVGPQTEQALHTALHEHAKQAAVPPTLDDPRSPDHALYEQALAGVRALDAHMGRTTDAQSLNLAAALTVEAKREGLTRIDRVALSDDASRTFAVQNTPSLLDPSKSASVDTVAAVNTPREHGTTVAAAIPVPATQPIQVQMPVQAQVQTSTMTL